MSLEDAFRCGSQSESRLSGDVNDYTFMSRCISKSGGSNSDPVPSVPISTAGPSVSSGDARARGPDTVPRAVTETLRRRVIAVPPSINNTGGSYCGFVRPRRMEGGGGPFTGASRVSAPEDSGRALPPRPHTGPHCERGGLRDRCAWPLTACGVLLSGTPPPERLYPLRVMRWVSVRDASMGNQLGSRCGGGLGGGIRFAAGLISWV